MAKFPKHGNRELNLINVTLNSKELRVIEQRITPEITEPGNYKLMAKQKKNNQKTQKAISKDIVISIPKPAQKTTIINNCTAITKEKTVYESKEIRAAKLAPLFFMAACFLFCLGVLYKRP